MKKLHTALLALIALVTIGCHRHSTGEGTTASRGGYTVRIEEGRLVLSDTIHFETESDQLAAESHVFLDLIAEVLRAHSGIEGVRIEGHTDSHGTDEHNQDLSDRRARAVADYLRAQGVEQTLTTAGFGFTRPLCTEESEECDARNRRVDFFWTSSSGD